MNTDNEFPKVCPSCESYEYHVCNRVRMLVNDVWGQGGSNQQRYEMWPCMNDWHEEGMRREWEDEWTKMSENERLQHVKEQAKIAKRFGLKYQPPEGYA